MRDMPYAKESRPLPDRRVSVQPNAGAMTESAIRAHLLGREAYRRTDFVVLRQGEATADAPTVDA